ncbi:MAG: UDP-N-acetylmuramyl-tripeptide synthetase [Firmicutes bacterium]|nr:UDP-N-acetylmuramyl-tripeptide synthetase [Bacillota bacterium]
MQEFYTLKTYEEAFEKAGILKASICPDNAPDDAVVRLVTFDSREAAEETLFFCKGAHFKADFLTDAVAAGAHCYVSEIAYDLPAEKDGHPVPPVRALLVTDIRKAMAIAAGIFYNDAWKRLHLIGLTGTKGKSTTAYFIKSILDTHLEKAMRPESAILSSIDNYDGVIREESHLTTPEAIVLHRRFFNAAEHGISHMTMEVSSQALKYDRTYGVRFEIGAFLNMGKDHISAVEHPDFEDYVNAKMKLFAQTRFAVINMDQTHWKRALEEAEKSDSVERIYTFMIEESHSADSDGTAAGAALGAKAAAAAEAAAKKAVLASLTKPHAMITGYDIRPGKKDITFRVRGGGMDEEFVICLPGVFNVQNALAAVTVSMILDIPVSAVREGLLKARVAGRMEVFTDKAEKKIVLVDYAHNAMSYNALFDAVARDYAGLPVYVLFGCPGGKALDRREELGRIAGQRADFTILTEEDPGEEDVVKISEEIAVHVEAAGGKYEIIPDREEAIRRSIFDTEDEAVILVLAKGRETRQKRGIEYVPVTSDVDLVERFLKEYDAEQ